MVDKTFHRVKRFFGVADAVIQAGNCSQEKRKYRGRER